MTAKRKIEFFLCACLVLSTAINVHLVLGRSPKAAKSLQVSQRFPPLGGRIAARGDSYSPAINQRRVYYWFRPTCPFCQENQGGAAQLARSLTTGEFVGISVDNDDLRGYIDNQQVAFPVLALSEKSPLAAKLGPTPTTFVVNASGIIEKVWAGAYVDSARLEIERYFSVSLPSLGSSSRSRTAAPLRATRRN